MEVRGEVIELRGHITELRGHITELLGHITELPICPSPKPHREQGFGVFLGLFRGFGGNGSVVPLVRYTLRSRSKNPLA